MRSRAQAMTWVAGGKGSNPRVRGEERECAMGGGEDGESERRGMKEDGEKEDE